MKLTTLQHMTTVEDALLLLMSHPYALNYKPAELAKEFKTGTLEEDMIASHLCGIANEQIALDFMAGSTTSIIPFFKNVAFNSEKSIPIIIRAINLSLI